MSKIIESNRLRLRRFKISDAEAIFSNYATDEKVTKYLTWTVHPNIEVTKSLLTSWIKEDDEFEPNVTRFAITLKDKDEVIGSIDLVRHTEVEIGYVLSRNYWNQGIMSEALKAFLLYLKEIGYKKMTIKADVDNISSNKVITKNGGIFIKNEEMFLKSKNKTRTLNCYYFDLLNI